MKKIAELVLAFSLIAKSGVTAPEMPLVAGKEPVIESVHVTIPGMLGERKLAYLSDLHIISMIENLSDIDKEKLSIRQKWASNGDVISKDQWPEWVEYLNAGDFDYVLFGADMIDFASEDTIHAFKGGLKNLKKPYMYVRADHDYLPYQGSGLTDRDGMELQKTVCEYADAFTKDFGDFILFGWNNSTSRMTEAGITKWREVLATGKPVIVLTHVPIEPLSDDSLATISKNLFRGEELLWGLNTNYYEPDDYTREFLCDIYGEGSPVKEILCGHLHYTWDGFVSPTVHQHVFSPAFQGYIGIIEISGR